MRRAGRKSPRVGASLAPPFVCGREALSFEVSIHTQTETHKHTHTHTHIHFHRLAFVCREQETATRVGAGVFISAPLYLCIWVCRI